MMRSNSARIRVLIVIAVSVLMIGMGAFAYFSASTGVEEQTSVSRPADHAVQQSSRTRQNPAVVPSRHPPPKLKHGQVLAKGSSAIKDALNQSGTPQEMERMKVEYYEESAFLAQTTGDYSALKDLFGAISQIDQYVLGLRLPAVFSEVGVEHDIREKLEILDSLQVLESQFKDLRLQIYTMEAKQRYDEVRDAGIIASLEPADFSRVCLEMGNSRLQRAFERVADGGTEEARRAAAAALGNHAMRTGTLEGSRMISNLPPGLIRDEAVAQMVIWLKSTGSAAEAAPWLETIQDATAKARASR